MTDIVQLIGQKHFTMATFIDRSNTSVSRTCWWVPVGACVASGYSFASTNLHKIALCAYLHPYSICQVSLNVNYRDAYIEIN